MQIRLSLYNTKINSYISKLCLFKEQNNKNSFFLYKKRSINQNMKKILEKGINQVLLIFKSL